MQYLHRQFTYLADWLPNALVCPNVPDWPNPPAPDVAVDCVPPNNGAPAEPKPPLDEAGVPLPNAL